MALRRAPFDLIFTLPIPHSFVMVHASSMPEAFDTALASKPLDRWFAYGGSLAEGPRNAQKEIYLKSPGEPGFHDWYYDSDSDHRFTSVRQIGNAIVATRTIATIHAAAVTDIAHYPSKDIYLVAVIGDGPTRTGFSEARRQAVRINFAEPATAQPAPQSTSRQSTTPGEEPPARIGSPGVTVPRQTRKVDPEYPPVAVAAKVEGLILLEVTVGSDGKVRDAAVIRSIPLLDRAALNAVRQWEYEPPRVAGKPRAVIFNVMMSFSLPADTR